MVDAERKQKSAFAAEATHVQARSCQLCSVSQLEWYFNLEHRSIIMDSLRLIGA